MTRKHLLTVGITILLLVAFVGTAAAQAAQPPAPTEEPTTEPVQPTSKFFYHPVVQILSAYFGRVQEEAVAEPTEEPTMDPNNPDITPVPTETPVDPMEQMAQEIAAYHEDGMGFGVLVKLYAMAEASQEACPTTPSDPAAPVDPTAAPACTAVTVDELVNSFRSGTGMGALFKQYGKPALLGVGHVRKALQALQQATPQPSPVVTFGQKGNGHKPDKGPHGNGNGKNK